MPVDVVEQLLGHKHALRRGGIEPTAACTDSTKFNRLFGSGFLDNSGWCARLLWHQFQVDPFVLERRRCSACATTGFRFNGDTGGAESLVRLGTPLLELEWSRTSCNGQWCRGMHPGKYHWSHAVQGCRNPGLWPQRRHLAPLLRIGSRSRLLVGDWCVVHGGVWLLL